MSVQASAKELRAAAARVATAESVAAAAEATATAAERGREEARVRLSVLEAATEELEPLRKKAAAAEAAGKAVGAKSIALRQLHFTHFFHRKDARAKVMESSNKNRYFAPK